VPELIRVVLSASPVVLSVNAPIADSMKKIEPT